MAPGHLLEPALLARARHLYENTSVRVADIAESLGVTERTLMKWRKQLGWRGRNEYRRALRITTDAVVEEAITPPAADASLDRAADRALTIARIRETVDREVSAVETSLRKLDRMAPRGGDVERSARTLASLVKTLNELKRLDATERDARPETEDDERDIDEFRRDLARRLDALCASRAEG
jgi:transposase-like protein